jgi:hypothetical protein
VDILRGYPGQDRVELAVATEEGVVRMELPNVSVGLCPELRQALVGLLGEDGLLEGGDGGEARVGGSSLS